MSRETEPTGGSSPTRPPNCLQCRHFFVTWDTTFPRGCRVFEVKTRELPSRVVYRATGKHCPAFERREHFKRKT
jgi:hypothetical protein